MNIILRVRLKELLAQKNMTQLQLAEKTELRKAAISEIVNNQRTTINRKHLEKIAFALDIKSVNELLEFVIED